MLRVKLRMLTWCRDVASVVRRRRHPGRQMELRFPLPLPEGPAPVPDWMLAFSLLGEIEADDPDEPTKREVERRMARRKQQQYTQGSHAAEAIHPGPSWREPEPMDRIVAEGKAAMRRLRATLAIPAETRLAGYVAGNVRARGKARKGAAA